MVALVPRLHTSWYNYLCGGVFALILLGNLFRWSFLDGADSHRCGAMLNEGSWLDPKTHTQWQPEGCYNHPLSHSQYLECLARPGHNTPQETLDPANSRVQGAPGSTLAVGGSSDAAPRRRALFIGDSTVRTLYAGFVREVNGPNGKYPDWWGNAASRHINQEVTVNDGTNSLQMDYWWDVYANSSRTMDLLSGQTNEPPLSLLVIGTGLWHMRNLGAEHYEMWASDVNNVLTNLTASQGSLGRPMINPWDVAGVKSQSPFHKLPKFHVPDYITSKFGKIHASEPEDIENENAYAEEEDVTGPGADDEIYEEEGEDIEAARRSFAARSLSSSWLDPRQVEQTTNLHPTIADTIIFIPVVDPWERKLNPSRGKTLKHAKAIVMNAGLNEHLNRQDPPPVVIPTMTNKMFVEDTTDDGIHFHEDQMDLQARIFLNWRCNDVMRDVSPIGACCRRYDWTRPVQAVLILILAVWGPMGMLMGNRLAPASKLRGLLPPATLASALTSFGMACLYLWLADRTPVFLKEQKFYDRYVVGGWFLAALAVGLATMRSKGKDQGYLNRDITDEWKGWMQIAILIYHFFGASKISPIYNPIRVLVAGYLFMTGYGHFFYYYKKADFGFNRVASVLVRLNLLSVVLPYTMNTDYLFYYFAPLVSFWYIVIYLTMGAFSSYNKRTSFLLAKLALSAGLMTFLFKTQWIMDAVFAILHAVFRIKWSASEWSFRVTLDLFVVWMGMLTALAYIKIKESGAMDRPTFKLVRNVSIGLSLIGMIWYFWFELRIEKLSYNHYHPFVSIIPILSYITLRNANATLRTYTSTVFCFIGQCSLETFILQFHGWLASDTHAILLVIPGTKHRPINMVISSIAFIWLSHKVSGATGEITEYLVGQGKSSNKTLPLPATASTAAAPVGMPPSGGGVGSPIPPRIAITSASSDAGSEAGSSTVTTGPEGAWLLDPESRSPISDSGVDLEKTVVLNEKTGLSGSPPTKEGLVGPVKSSGTSSSGLGKLGDMIRKNNMTKLGFVLFSLWVLNWIY